MSGAHTTFTLMHFCVHTFFFTQPARFFFFFFVQQPLGVTVFKTRRRTGKLWLELGRNVVLPRLRRTREAYVGLREARGGPRPRGVADARARPARGCTLRSVYTDPHLGQAGPRSQMPGPQLSARQSRSCSHRRVTAGGGGAVRSAAAAGELAAHARSQPREWQ